eukprot:NODE_4152_length_1108_cov_80.694416_g3955_i0.p1 GENE.NODE_4152_length_1108_cov_80.694416_g3955_i0~~NODE_4152_length_1108_cov_80.694416_g3955_i0.p1  ORF type:complete len:328 (-),score=69.46 NODE_4152_length_1108_cov_80.694416_g3955_i0:125-1048(-)
MCILAFCLKGHPRYPLVLINNRDEGPRETHFAKVTNNVLCGVDGVYGGTWMALNVETGELAVLTNVRCNWEKADDIQPRGKLVELFVTASSAELESVNIDHYGPMNIVHGNIFPTDPAMTYYSNNPKHRREKEVVGEGSHCVSNSWLDDSTWPKVSWLSSKLESVLQEKGDGPLSDLIEALNGLLCATDVAPDESTHPAAMFGEGLATSKPAVEHRLQRHIFLPPDSPFRTRQQTIILTEILEDDPSKLRVHYYYRHTEENTDSEYTKFTYDVPLPTATPAPDGATQGELKRKCEEGGSAAKHVKSD